MHKFVHCRICNKEISISKISGSMICRKCNKYLRSSLDIADKTLSENFGYLRRS
jgi:hypothetical protein